MQINVTMNGGTIDVDIQWAVTKSLHQSTQLVRWKAIQNAPIKSWTLRRSITTAMWVDKMSASVWTNVKYGRVREFINKKNPHTKFYMKRALESSSAQIQQIFYKNIKNELS